MPRGLVGWALLCIVLAITPVASAADGSAGLGGILGGLLGGQLTLGGPAPEPPAPQPVPDPATLPEAPPVPEAAPLPAPATPAAPLPDLGAASTPAAPVAAPQPASASPELTPPQVSPPAPWKPPTPQSPAQVPGGTGSPPIGATAPPLPGTGKVAGADLGLRQGLGPSLQQGATESFGAPGAWVQSLPSGMREVAQGGIALLLTGLAAVAAHMAGFRHVGRENLLEHDFRQQLLNLVREHPGMHLRELARQQGLTTTNASYHLRMLERHGLVRSERVQGKRVYYPAAGRDDRQRYLAQSLLYQAPRARILAAIGEHPGVNQSRLAALTQQHQGAVSWHIRQLVGAGMVVEQRTPRQCQYQLTDLGRTFAGPDTATPHAGIGYAPPVAVFAR